MSTQRIIGDIFASVNQQIQEAEDAKKTARLRGKPDWICQAFAQEFLKSKEAKAALEQNSLGGFVCWDTSSYTLELCIYAKADTAYRKFAGTRNAEMTFSIAAVWRRYDKVAEESLMSALTPKKYDILDGHEEWTLQDLYTEVAAQFVRSSVMPTLNALETIAKMQEQIGKEKLIELFAAKKRIEATSLSFCKESSARGWDCSVFNLELQKEALALREDLRKEKENA